jgi:hypothetical protein
MLCKLNKKISTGKHLLRLLSAPLKLKHSCRILNRRLRTSDQAKVSEASEEETTEGNLKSLYQRTKHKKKSLMYMAKRIPCVRRRDVMKCRPSIHRNQNEVTTCSFQCRTTSSQSKSSNLFFQAKSQRILNLATKDRLI